MANQNQNATLPGEARLPVNRCNLPAVILGSLTFQHHPAALYIDGVQELHRDFFQRLSRLHSLHQRQQCFNDYMTVYFRLANLDHAGYTPDTRLDRSKANYLRLIRGWFFNPDGIEGAVIKGWVESRFGLLPRFHKQRITTPDNDAYREYEYERAHGLYNTNALEMQLDLLHSYGQYELSQRFPGQIHVRLFRGYNSARDMEFIETTRVKQDKNRRIVLLNSVNSFSADRERADEFGDIIGESYVPLSKIFVFNNLLPGLLPSEDEYVVLGGVYEISVLRS
jgi:NAD+--dinitrogen-reductase ADP-D-ribosyltransferase